MHASVSATGIPIPTHVEKACYKNRVTYDKAFIYPRGVLKQIPIAHANYFKLDTVAIVFMS